MGGHISWTTAPKFGISEALSSFGEVFISTCLNLTDNNQNFSSICPAPQKMIPTIDTCSGTVYISRFFPGLSLFIKYLLLTRYSYLASDLATRSTCSCFYYPQCKENRVLIYNEEKKYFWRTNQFFYKKELFNDTNLRDIWQKTRKK